MHHGGILFVEIGYQICPTQPLHECPPESARHQSKQNGNDWQQHTFPIVQQEAKTTPSLLSAVSSTQIAPTLQRRGSPGLLQLEDERNYWQLKQKRVRDRATIDSAHQSLLTMFKLPPKTNKESPRSNTGVFLEGGASTISASKAPPTNWNRDKTIGVLTDFKKEMQQTELHASHLVHVKVPVNSLPLKHNAIQWRRVRKGHQHKERRKTLPQDYPHRLCVPSPSSRRQSGAKRRQCWQPRRPNGAYSNRWSVWLSSKRAGRTSNPASQRPLADWR